MKAKIFSYFLASAVIIGSVFVGSTSKTTENSNTPIMLSITENNYSVSVDQLSEL